MSLPKATKVTKNGVEFIDNIDLTVYSLNQLARAALRDIGKFICSRFRTNFYRTFKKITGRVSRFTQYWVRTKGENPDLIVGTKRDAFYNKFHELGTSKTKKRALLFNTVKENIDTIQKIAAQYLKQIEQDNPQLESEDDYSGS